MAVTVEELVVRMRADLDQYEAGLRQAQRTTDAAMAAIETRFARANSHLYNSVSDTMVRINGLLAGVGVGVGVAELAGFADAWTRVTRAVDATNQVFGIQVASASRIAQMAVETRSDLEATEKLYLRTAVAVSKLGRDVSVAETVTTTFAKALKLGGAATAEQKSAMEQFSQALQKGKLDGDEFRSIMENAGVVQQALIEKYKVSGSVLMDMAHKGKITAKDIVEALEKIKPKVDAAFDQAPVTLSESFVNLKTAITEYVGEASRADGVMQTMSASITVLAQNIDMLARGAMAVGVALGLAFTPAVVGAVEALTARMAVLAVATGPVRLAAGTLVAAMVALTSITRAFGDQIMVLEARGLTLEDVYHGFFLEVNKLAFTAFTSVSDLAKSAFDTMRGALGKTSGDAKTTMADVQGAVKAMANGVIGAFAALSYGVAAMATSVFGTVPSAIVAMLNKALLQVQAFARGVAETLNAIPGVSIDVDGIKAPEITDVFARTAKDAEALWLEASKAMGRDYIGEMGGGGRRGWKEGHGERGNVQKPPQPETRRRAR